MDTIRTSVDIPKDLHKRLHEVAARRGCSARSLILESLERFVQSTEPVRRRHKLRLDKPIVASRGHVFDLTSEQIHDLIEFP